MKTNYKLDRIRKLNQGVPLKIEISNQLIGLIETEDYESGSQLPSEQDLADAFGVSRVTIREALSALELEGFIVRKHGVGTFVRGPINLIDSPMEVNLGVTEVLRRNGMEPGVTNLEITRVPANQNIEKKLDYIGDVYVIKRTRTVKGIPIVFTVDHIPEPFVQDEDKLAEYANKSLYEYYELEIKVDLDFGFSKIVPELTNAELAMQLQVPIGCPVILIEQVDYATDGKPVLLSYEYYMRRGIQFSVVRSRKHPPIRPDYISF